MRDLLKRHPNVNIIWAHAGLGRVVHPVEGPAVVHAARPGEPGAPRLLHRHLLGRDGEVRRGDARVDRRPSPTLINQYPDRWLFGTDEVAPTDQGKYLKTYDIYAPLFAKLTPEARQKVLKGNYERLFDEARRRVRAWEKAHVK